MPSQSSQASSGGPLVCPRCAQGHGLEDRFCRDCGMPLVYVGKGELEPITGAHERARKIKPQYTEGELMRVAGGRNQAEAEMIQGMLLEEGIPSILRRTRGFDVPDFLAAGPRDVMVSQSAYEAASTLLTGADVVSEEALAAAPAGTASPVRLLLGVILAVAVAALIVWLLFQATA